MTRLSLTAALAGSLTCLALAALGPSGCASAESPRELEDGGAAGTSAGGRPSAGSAGKPGSVGGSGGSAVTSGGSADSGGDSSAAEGGEASAAGDGGSGPAPTDRCQVTADCKQVEGSCFVCEAKGGVKDCVDQGPPVCDNGQLDPCEVCEIDEQKDCAELSKAGEFSGGKASCKASCDGWDTSTCSVCGNGVREDGEACDTADPATPRTCADEGIEENADQELPCTDECRYDTTLCGGCSKGAPRCLDGESCSGSACSGSECKIGTTCDIDCAGGGSSCDGVRCNHDATCDIDCSASARCTNVVCDATSTCKLDCSGGGSSCDGTLCKAGAQCSFVCGTAGNCKNIRCQPGAACDFSCVGGGSTCSGTAECGAGSTCDFDCSDSGSCSGLAVTCRKDSTCHFTCQGGGSVCPKARCEAGSICTFACAGGNCNAPECESDDDCTGN